MNSINYITIFVNYNYSYDLLDHVVTVDMFNVYYGSEVYMYYINPANKGSCSLTHGQNYDLILASQSFTGIE